MNIFYLDHDPVKCAQYHVDKHVIKMVLETAQILSTVHHLQRSPLRFKLYKPTHENHPSTKWANLCGANYDWLYSLFVALNEEYGHRYGKWHKSFLDLSTLLRENPHKIQGMFTQPTPAMDGRFIVGDSIESYRNYYRHGKIHLHQWSKRSKPEWL